jgi:hypothetical protein
MLDLNSIQAELSQVEQTVFQAIPGCLNWTESTLIEKKPSMSASLAFATANTSSAFIYVYIIQYAKVGLHWASLHRKVY